MMFFLVGFTNLKYFEKHVTTGIGFLSFSHPYCILNPGRAFLPILLSTCESAPQNLSSI